MVNEARHLIAQPCSARRFLLFPAIPLRPRRGFSLRCLTCTQRSETHPGNGFDLLFELALLPVTSPALSPYRYVHAGDFLHGETAVLALMIYSRLPKSQVPYRYLNNRHRRPFQPSPDQETAQRPPNDLSPGYSGHLLTVIGIRLNT